MAKNMKKKQKRSKETVPSETGSINYRLKSQAVEELVDANSGNAPEYSQEELERYRRKSKFSLPQMAKLVLIKAWFPGAVCYFVLWGLGVYTSSMLDMLFILGIVMGMVTDLLTNNVLRFLEKTPGESERWLMVRRKGVIGFFLNIFYGFVILFCVFMLYNLINRAIITITGDADSLPLGVEPVLFGTFCMGFDMLFVTVKQRIRRALEKA